jgi:uncharacterized protein (TIGR04255 family)
MNPQYGKPPITEAILDIRVEPRPGVSAIEIAEGFRAVEREYPNRQELPPMSIEQEWEWTAAANQPPRLKAAPVLGGFRYESADRRRIVQARREGFVFSLLPPYTSWGEFSQEARRVWEVYRATWRPKQINRIALRYVNHLNFGEKEVELASSAPDRPFVPLHEYLTMVPHEDVEQRTPNLQYSHLGMTLLFEQPDIEAIAVINHAMVPPLPPFAISVLLDIDLYRQNLDWKADDAERLWNALETLRVRKNELFRACLTPKGEARLEPKNAIGNNI